VLGIHAKNAYNALSFNDLALVAHFFYTCSNFHVAESSFSRVLKVNADMRTGLTPDYTGANEDYTRGDSGIFDF
jgi:hypothetical protein